MSFDLYLWAAPREIDADAARELVDRWLAEGGEPAASPFEPSTDVAWCYIELLKDMPEVDATSDAVADPSRRPIWLSTGTPEPARVIALRLPRDEEPLRDVLEEVFGLALKYDLVMFEPSLPRIRRPMAEMAAYASATFWPRGAIRGFVAGLVGLALAVGAWMVGVPILSGLLVIVGAFLVVLTVVTFVHEARDRWRRRRAGP